ncbi:hypothetical protein [Smaragdicoccus niigatensis]|uniref:hypothetical protein n=1 Tax=Smaragdicoccus niigatensis TaxID=359359 RepID=UPI00036801BF|nr:hypothetical protein [Smaragdicoccus niigatensis]
MTIADVDPRIVDSTIVEEDFLEGEVAPASETESPDEALMYDAVKADLAAGNAKAADRSPTEATFSVTQAAEACLVSRKTIVRRLPQLEEFGAWKDSQGQWVIPLSALLAADLRPGRPSRPEQEPPKPAAAETKPVTSVHVEPVVTSADGHAVNALRAEIENWQRRATDAEKRAAVAEAIATERAGRVDDLRLALRQLEPVRTVPAQVVEEQQAKRGWRRFF